SFFSFCPRHGSLLRHHVLSRPREYSIFLIGTSPRVTSRSPASGNFTGAGGSNRARQERTTVTIRRCTCPCPEAGRGLRSTNSGCLHMALAPTACGSYWENREARLRSV